MDGAPPKDSCISLRPFDHQVAGHFLVLEISKDKLCKPLVSREKLFYDSIPVYLKEFAPEFFGVMLVQFSKDDKGVIDYTGCFKEDGLGGDTQPSSVTKTLASETNVGNMTVEEEELERLSHLKCSLRNDKSKAKSFEVPFGNGDSFNNPWTESRLKVFSKAMTIDEWHEYIVLENLTGNYHCPCVLDLKIGTRSYTDVMSPRKRQEHLERAASTTTSTLGLRFCGMQLYKPFEKSYSIFDKYYGHSLTEETIGQTIRSFVFDGRNYQLDVIAELVSRLKKLRDVIGRLDSYRFFSSSLLLIYEGDEETRLQQKVKTPDTKKFFADIRMIDFANLTHNGFVNDPVQYQGPDDGYIYGLTSLITLFESIIN